MGDTSNQIRTSYNTSTKCYTISIVALYFARDYEWLRWAGPGTRTGTPERDRGVTYHTSQVRGSGLVCRSDFGCATDV